jgi:hypothetical protein
MTELQASRTLVKSPPELWAECSDAGSLARHLDGFGEIRITRLDPETAVAWEGERARGTVRIEPAGWGTKVILTAQPTAEDPVMSTEPSTEPDRSADPDRSEEPDQSEEPPPPPPRNRRLTRLWAWLRGPEPELEPEAPAAIEPPPPPEPEPEPAAIEPPPELAPPAPQSDAEAALSAALDSLGQAHHRPYSRA